MSGRNLSQSIDLNMKTSKKKASIIIKTPTPSDVHLYNPGSAAVDYKAMMRKRYIRRNKAPLPDMMDEDISYDLERMYDPCNFYHIPEEKRLDKFVKRDLKFAKQFKACVKLFRVNPQRIRKIVAPPMDTMTKRRMGVFIEPDVYPEDKVLSTMPLNTPNYAAIEDPKPDKEIQKTAEVKPNLDDLGYKLWMTERQQLRNDLNNLNKISEILTRKADKTILEKRMLQTLNTDQAIDKVDDSKPKEMKKGSHMLDNALKKIHEFLQKHKLVLSDLFLHWDHFIEKMTPATFRSQFDMYEIKLDNKDMQALVFALDPDLTSDIYLNDFNNLFDKWRQENGTPENIVSAPQISMPDPQQGTEKTVVTTTDELEPTCSPKLPTVIQPLDFPARRHVHVTSKVNTRVIPRRSASAEEGPSKQWGMTSENDVNTVERPKTCEDVKTSKSGMFRKNKPSLKSVQSDDLVFGTKSNKYKKIKSSRNTSSQVDKKIPKMTTKTVKQSDKKKLPVSRGNTRLKSQVTRDSGGGEANNKRMSKENPEVFVQSNDRQSTVTRLTTEKDRHLRLDERLPPIFPKTNDDRIDPHCQRPTIQNFEDIIQVFRSDRLEEYYDIVQLCEEHDIIFSKEILKKALMYPGDRSYAEINGHLRQPGCGFLPNFDPKDRDNGSDSDDSPRFRHRRKDRKWCDVDMVYPFKKIITPVSHKKNLSTGRAAISRKLDCWMTFEEYERLTGVMTVRYLQKNKRENYNPYWPGQMLDRIVLCMPPYDRIPNQIDNNNPIFSEVPPFKSSYPEYNRYQKGAWPLEHGVAQIGQLNIGDIRNMLL